MDSIAEASSGMGSTTCRLGISTMSLGHGHAGHSLELRLRLAAQHGYKGIELYYDDLEHFAKCDAAAPTDAQLLEAAIRVRDECGRLGLDIICLQPFRHYEGLLDRDAHAAHLGELRLWCRLTAVLGTDLILIPSNFLPAAQLSDDMELIVQDLRDAADVAAAAQPPVRICYEALAWGTRIDTWEVSWDVVQRVDRVNFGLCLDTFNIAARIFADPAVEGGVQPDGLARVQNSIKTLETIVDVECVFLLQIADGARLEKPLQPGHPLYDPAQPVRMSWSRNSRLFYGETDHGAYMPVASIIDTICNGLGYRGWVSMELFNKRMSDADADVPVELVQRGSVSWDKLVRELQLPVQEDEIPDHVAPSNTKEDDGRDKHPEPANGSDIVHGDVKGAVKKEDESASEGEAAVVELSHDVGSSRCEAFARKVLGLCGASRKANED